MPDPPRLRSNTNLPNVSRVPPWCSGSPAGCACHSPCVLCARWVCLRFHLFYRGITRPNPKHSFCLPRFPRFVQTLASMLPRSLYPWLGTCRPHPILGPFLPMVPTVPVDELDSQLLLRPRLSVLRRPSFASLSLASLANSPFLACSAFSSSALSFLTFNSIRTSLSCGDDASSFPDAPWSMNAIEVTPC